jgi:hypothetical protein
MADCNEKYFPNGPVDVCADQWLSWWMCKNPYKGTWADWKTLSWLVAGVILKQMAKADGWCCIPSCLGKECGDDGCDGSCGLCPKGSTCAYLATGGTKCIPSSCSPACGPTEKCIAGECVCVPQCLGKQCGDDGCGNSCGDCPPGQVCKAGDPLDIALHDLYEELQSFIWNHPLYCGKVNAKLEEYCDAYCATSDYLSKCP